MTGIRDSFIIGAYWGSRLESIEQVSSKILQTIKLLAETDEQFTALYELGMSRKKALEKKVAFDIESINMICRKAVKKGELDKNGIAKYGFGVGLWSGHADEEASTISFWAGHAFDPITKLNNSCVVKIPFEGKARERLLQQDKVKKILNFLVEIWSPDYAVLISDVLRDKLDTGNSIGWITYQQSVNAIPQFNNGIIYEKTNNGHWFYPTYNSYQNSLINDLLLIKEVI